MDKAKRKEFVGLTLSCNARNNGLIYSTVCVYVALLIFPWYDNFSSFDRAFSECPHLDRRNCFELDKENTDGEGDQNETDCHCYPVNLRILQFELENFT